MRIVVESVPDWAEAARDFSATTGSLLVRAAVEMILDNTGRILRGITLSGDKQKENVSESYRKLKFRLKGHQIPLRWNDVMSNPNEWLINNQPATQYLGTFARRAARWPRAVRTHHFRIGAQFVSVRFPPSRVEIAIQLAKWGYGVPFGVTPEVEAIIHEVGELEMRSAAQRAEFGFRIIYREA